MKAASALWVFATIAVLGAGIAVWAYLPSRDDDLPPAGLTSEGPNDDGRIEHVPEAPTPATIALQRGVEYLIAAQAEDGAWRSDTYGQMKGGASITALVTYALSHVPESLRSQHDARLKRALELLRGSIHQGGYITNRDGSPDYPTYATAMTLVAAHKLGRPLAKDETDKLTGYLVEAQLSERYGWKPDDVHYGGWEIVGGSAIGRHPFSPGTNLSATCSVLEALSIANHPGAIPAIRRADAWLARCQNYPGDGGFFFSPVLDDLANKAGAAESPGEGTAKSQDEQLRRPRSYGTMTCDGARSLLYGGTAPDSPHAAAGLAWIAEHSTLDVVPGFEALPPENGWQDGLRFYYYASLAKLLPHLPDATRESIVTALASKLVSLQHKDGRWENPSARMREDDPLIATAFVVIALSELESARQ